ncbi:uncharacterized protein DUF563 [Primorskyibacter sedentarius]|uniref:Uncharacterized protein DUF563 n=1 Tax=Primorskyibacter sedentarius TaxID=745311 RepID=A0A4V6NYF7_9RHOB|nr:uncharacterized protein DUF563 [Primorskyibacter sedentarius]
MRVNTPLLAWGLRRFVTGRTPDLHELATRSWEISPALSEACPPAIHLPDALDRITALSPWRDWESERRFIEGGVIEHAATRAHLVEDVDISGAFLYRSAAKMRAGFGPQQMIRKGGASFQRISEAHLVSNWAGSQYFGIFLRAILPMELLPGQGAPMISVVTKPYEHEDGYRQILSMPPPPRVASARVKRLTLYTDFGQNASKAVRYAELRARLRRTLTPPAPEAPPTGVYLKRGDTGERRHLTNEAQVEAALAALGFDIVEPSKLEPRTIAQRLLDAPIVVSVEGSHLAHAIYPIAENGTLVVLQPPDRFAMAFKEFTDRADLRFAFTVGRPAPNGFSVDIDDLKHTLDMVS